MKRANIRLSLFRLFPVQLLALLDNVIAKLTDNPHYPDLPIDLAELTALRDELKAAIEAATAGRLVDKKIRDQKVAEVRDALRVTADYVRAEANGDAVILATSGFELAKQPEPINGVGVPGKVVATATDVAGEVLIRWGKVTGAIMFRLDQAESDPTVGNTTWKTIGQVGRQSFVAEGLESYKAYWFRVTALGTESEGLPSDAVLGRAA